MTVQVTDSDTDTLPVNFNVTIVDDVPQANNDGPAYGGGRHDASDHTRSPTMSPAPTASTCDGVAVATGRQGTLVYNNNGSFTYTPNANAEGADASVHDHGRRRRHLDGDGFDHLAGGLGAERDGERRDG